MIDGTLDAVLRGGVGQRLANGVVVELEARPFQCRRDGALPAEQALVGELTQQCAQRESGHHQRRRPVHRPADAPR